MANTDFTIAYHERGYNPDPNGPMLDPGWYVHSNASDVQTGGPFKTKKASEKWVARKAYPEETIEVQTKKGTDYRIVDGQDLIEKHNIR